MARFSRSIRNIFQPGSGSSIPHSHSRTPVYDSTTDGPAESAAAEALSDGIKNAWFAGVLVRNNQLVGFEMGDNRTYKQHLGSAGDGTGSIWDNLLDGGGKLSEELVAVLNGASEQNPVKLIFARQGNKLSVYVEQGDTVYLVVKEREHAAFAETYGLDFGYGWRTDVGGTPTIQNIRFVIGEGKTQLYLDSLTVKVEAGENVTLDKTSYAFGDTVTLTAAEAETGKVFAYFTVDGKQIDGNTFVVEKSVYDVKAVYTEISEIELGSGVKTEDGKTTYGRGVTVTLALDDTVSQEGVFDGFKVDGVMIDGNTFETSAASHTVEAVFVTEASQMTWKEVTYTAPTGTIASWGAYEKLGSDANWVVTYEVTATNAADKGAWYTGVLVRNNQLVGFEMGSDSWKNILGSAGGGTGSTWDNLLDGGGKLSEELVTVLNGASEQNPVKLIFARQGNKLSVYVEQGGTVYLVVKEREHAAFAETYGYDFGYGWRTDVGGTPTIQNIRFVIGEGKTQLYLASLTVKITTDGNVTLDKTSYTFGDTVTLTAAEAETGEAFAYFTVDGKQIDGNTFVVEKSVYDVKAVYIDLADSYKIVLGEHEESVVTDGEYTIATASVADGEGSPVEGYTVVAKVTDETGAAYEVQDGKITLTYKGVMKYTVTYSAEGLEDKDVSYTVTLYGSSDGTIVTAGETAAKLIAANGTNATVTADTAQKYGSEAASVKITVNTVLEKQDYAYLPAFDFGDCDYIEFYAYTTAASAQIGAWWYGDTNLKQNEWTYVQLGLNSSNLKDGRWIIRLMNVAAGDSVYISSMKIVRHEGVILDLSKGATKGEWSTEKVYDGDDAAVDKTGALKLTPDSGDYYDIKATGGVMLRDIRKYSSVYFYVYTETEGAMVGVTWCGDTYPPAGQWTKVTITSDMYGSLDGDGGNMAQFRFRIKDGNGGTFYITSLYGVR